jgi:hypothetical protein
MVPEGYLILKQTLNFNKNDNDPGSNHVPIPIGSMQILYTIKKL